jgi:tetratricopeptide (TPR) repeat protein
MPEHTDEEQTSQANGLSLDNLIPANDTPDSGDHEDVHIGAAEWAESHPNRTDALIEAGKTLDAAFHDEDWDTALTAASTLVESAPDDAVPYLYRANVYVEKEMMDEALADYGKSIELDPEDVDSLVQRGRAKYGMEDTDGAIADFKAAIKIDPQHAPAYIERGYAFFSKGALDAALSDFKNYTRLVPENPIGHNNQAFVAMWMGRTSAAEALWRKATSLPDAPHWAFAGHAVALHKMKKRRNAIEQYRRAVEQEPRWASDVKEVADEFSWPATMITMAEEIVARLGDA